MPTIRPRPLAPNSVAAALAATLLLAACSSTPPTRYYTLEAPPVPVAHNAAFRIEVLPVDVPEQVSRPQIVLRIAPGRLQSIETQRWIAPLDDELREALSGQLSARLGADDVSGLPAPPPDSHPSPVYRIKLKVERFDSTIGASAHIAALWNWQEDPGQHSLTCSSDVTEATPGGYEALAQGHQRAIAAIAAQIAASLTGGHCPGA